MKKIYPLLMVLGMALGYSQPISVSTSTYSVQQLVDGVLVNTPCADVSNITSITGVNYSDVNGIGYFTNTNPNFPMSSGIVLSTGNVLQAPGPSSGNQVAGGYSWPGDAQLTNYMNNYLNNTSAYYNATILEFDFVPYTNEISFNFVFASDEYGSFQCSYSDSFAFFLTNTATNETTNLALVPNTTTPISVVTIRDNAHNQGCESVNPEYFGSYNQGDPNSAINFRGQTVKMVAQSDVVPGQTYHIKLVIQDRGDTSFNSAVFLEAGSFSIGTPDLGEDYIIEEGNGLCVGEEKLLETGLDPELFAFQWHKNGVNIPGATGSSYAATSSGVYGVNVTSITGGCVISPDPVTLEFFNEIVINHPPLDLTLCAMMGGSTTFDLRDSQEGVTNSQATFTYFLTQQDAINNVNAINHFYSLDNDQESQTIWVRIQEVNSPCVRIESFTINIQTCPLFLNQLENIHKCANDTNLLFDFSSYENLVYWDNLGYSVTFHHSEVEADNAQNPIAQNLWSAYPGTHNERIWVRVSNNENINNYGVTSFYLFIHSVPTPNTNNAPIVSCEMSGAGLAQFNLALNYHNIVGNQVEYNVSYYLTETQAELGYADLQLPLEYIGQAGTIYARVENGITGCSVVVPQQLQIVPQPEALEISPLTKCDQFNDGREIFNLEPTGILIAGNPLPAGVLVSYHETLTDAQLNQNAILNVNNYENITLYNQTLYVRVGYSNSECASIVPLQLQVISTPEITSPTPLVVCDLGNNSVETFDLTSKIPEILNGLNASDYIVTFHLTEENAELGNNAIANPTVFSNQTAQIVYVRVENLSTGCYSVVKLSLQASPIPVAPSVLPTYNLCDTNNDGYEIFDLQSQISSILGSQQGIEVTFHYTSSDAESGLSPLPNHYQNVSANVQTLFVRLYNPTTGCYTVTTMDIRVQPNPLLNVPTTPYVICNIAGTGGFGTIDLTSYGNALVSGTGFTIEYFETESNAQSNVLPIASPFAYNNLQQSTPVVWIRVTNPETGCYSIYPINFQLVTAPNMPLSLPELSVCDTFGNHYDGIGVIDLTMQNELIENANSGDLTGFVIRYYTSESDALSGINWIGNPSEYQNLSNPQTIWVSVENQSNPLGCKRIRSFTITVNKPIFPTQPTPISICESHLPNDGIQVVDLTQRELQILGGVQTYGVEFEYYETELSMEQSVGAISNPTSYTTQSANQTIYVKIINQYGCVSSTTLQLRVLPLPEVEMSPTALQKCETELGSGTAFFDLTSSEFEIGREATNLTFTYYTTYEGALAEDANSQIGTPEEYLSDSTTVYVRVENQLSIPSDQCAVIVELQLIVNPTPSVGPMTPLFACLDNSTGYHTFNLHDKDAEALAGQDASLYSVRYYISEESANEGLNPIPYIYTNLLQGEQIIWVRVEHKESKCYAVSSLRLKVEEKVYAFAPTSTTFCEIDYHNNGVTPVDLTVLDAEIISVQNASPLAVRYYRSNGALITDPTNYIATNGEEIIAEVYIDEEGSLCTATVSFVITTKEGPEIKEIPNGVVCFDYRDNTLIRGHYMDTGLPNNANYQYEWTLNGTVVGTSNSYTATQSGTYTVKVTYVPTGCTNTRTIEVVQGPSITIDDIRFTESFSEQMSIEVIAYAGAGVGLEYALDEGPWQDGNVFEGVTPGEHLVRVRVKDNPNYCPAEEIVQVLSHPPFFTPNGDGYNDTWNIVALKDQVDAKIHIFDRYGKLLKSISPSGAGWDGKFNGQDMPATDYWFKAIYKDPKTGLQKEATGHFSLKR